MNSDATCEIEILLLNGKKSRKPASKRWYFMVFPCISMYFLHLFLLWCHRCHHNRFDTSIGFRGTLSPSQGFPGLMSMARPRAWKGDGNESPALSYSPIEWLANGFNGWLINYRMVNWCVFPKNQKVTIAFDHMGRCEELVMTSD